MTNASITIEGLVFILISGAAAILLSAQEIQTLQAGQNPFVNNTITNATELLDNMSQHARDLIDEGDYYQALQILNEIMNLDANSTDALTNKGRTLFYLGQYDEAIEYFDRAIRMDPRDTLAMNGKGGLQ